MENQCVSRFKGDYRLPNFKDFTKGGLSILENNCLFSFPLMVGRLAIRLSFDYNDESRWEVFLDFSLRS